MHKKILIIEDEQTLVKALSAGLTEANGYKIEIAIDGEEGLRKAKEFKPDLILLDLILPKMDGFEVLQKIKQDNEIKHAQVLVLTNLSDVTEKVLKLGATDYLVKADHTMDEIKDKIKQHLK